MVHQLLVIGFAIYFFGFCLLLACSSILSIIYVIIYFILTILSIIINISSIFSHVVGLYTHFNLSSCTDSKVLVFLCHSAYITTGALGLYMWDISLP